MKIINNIMILALLVLPAYSAGVSDGFESIESVFRVRNMSELEDFQTKLRHFLEQRSALQVWIKDLGGSANCFANSNPEIDTLVEKMGLTLDEDFINSMGAEFRGMNVASYKNHRVDLADCVRSLEDYCSRWCAKARIAMVANLILVDEFLRPIDLTEGVRAFTYSFSLGCDDKDDKAVCSCEDQAPAPSFSLGCDDKAVCSYEDQAPAPNKFMSCLENFIAAIQDTKRLTQEHLTSVVACINSVGEIAQDESSSDDHGSDLARLCEKSKLKKTLLNYKAYLSRALDAPMSKCLNMLTKCLEKERAFWSDPLVVLQEECSHLTLEERRADLRDNLDEFMKMECESK